MEEKTVTMSAQELSEFEQFKAVRQKRKREELRTTQLEQYKEMVDDELSCTMSILEGLSKDIGVVKGTVMENFQSIIALKSELFNVKEEQRSHTFTHGDGTLRLTLGINTTDGYRDTVEEGIAIVREYLSSLASDDKTSMLVDMVNRLLSRDAKGTLKASRVIQLRKMAEKTGDERFLEGIRIIEDAYQPQTTRQYIRAEKRDEQGAWVAIPLGMTEA